MVSADLYSSERQCCALLMTKVLVSDPIDQAGIDILSQVAQVDQRPGLSPEELVQLIGDYDETIHTCSCYVISSYLTHKP